MQRTRKFWLWVVGIPSTTVFFGLLAGSALYVSQTWQKKYLYPATVVAKYEDDRQPFVDVKLPSVTYRRVHITPALYDSLRDGQRVFVRRRLIGIHIIVDPSDSSRAQS